MGRIENLEKIRYLKNEGIITQEEFEIEKQKILLSNTDEDTSGTGVYFFSLCISILSLILCLVPVVGMVIGFIAKVVSLKAKDTMERRKENKAIVTATLIISALGVILGTIVTGICTGVLIYTAF